MEATPPCLGEFAAVIATVIAIKGGHTKYKHLQRLQYSCLKVYTRNHYLLLNSSIIVNYIKMFALVIPMHDFWPPLYKPPAPIPVHACVYGIELSDSADNFYQSCFKKYNLYRKI